MKFNDIIIPTVESVRTNFLVHQLVTNSKPVLLMGPTGTGKTSSFKSSEKMIESSHPKTHCFNLSLSMQTTVSRFQNDIELHLQKRGKNRLGPAQGQQALEYVYKQLLAWGFQDATKPLKTLFVSSTKAMISMYSWICENVRPTPTKFLYVFNLRDLSSVVQGIICGKLAVNNNPDPYLQLWCHEICRVFSDRMVDQFSSLRRYKLFGRLMGSS